VNRLAYRFYRRISGLSHWASRRLTPAGWLVALGILFTGGMATDAEQSVGYQAFAVFACFTFAAIATAPFFRVRYEAERNLPRFGTAGQPLHYQITISNRSAATQKGLFVFDDLADPRAAFDEFKRATQATSRRKTFRVARSQPSRRVKAPKPQPLPALLPRSGTAEVDMILYPSSRGPLRFKGVSLARPDPFMLFRAFASVNLPATVTILPKRYPLPNIVLPGSARHQQGGVAFASAVGESEEFIAVRDYREGDPRRRIHWRSWAKTGKPVVKEFQDEFFVRHALILDTFTEPDNVDVFEEAVSVAASFACTIDTQESLLDLLFVGPQAYCFTVGRGVGHADQMLEILASVQTCSDKAFGTLEQAVLEHSAAVSGCICIFVAWDKQREQLVQKLEALGVPLLILLLQEAGAANHDRFAVSSRVHEIQVDKVAEKLALL
jgi:hypothetical protein